MRYQEMLIVSSSKPMLIIADNSTAVTGPMMAICNATDRLREQYYLAQVLLGGSRGSAVLEAVGYRVHRLLFADFIKGCLA